MPNKQMRVVPVMTYLEPTLHTRLLDELASDPQSSASYIRGLVLRDLIDKGRITMDEVANMTGGVAA